jgi:site-specific recombinase XerD
MIEDLERRNYSKKTIKSYVATVAAFAKFHGRSPEQLNAEHIRTWQLHLIKERKLSWSYVNVAVCALRCLYGIVLDRKEVVPHIPYGKRAKKLPRVLSREEVLRFIDAIDDGMVRMLVMTLYAAGLRISEGLHLRVEDVDSARMLLHVNEGKGRKDRLVPLSPALLELFRAYWHVHRPTTWMFPGQQKDQPISSATVGRALKRAADRHRGQARHGAYAASLLRDAFARSRYQRACGAGITRPRQARRRRVSTTTLLDLN